MHEATRMRILVTGAGGYVGLHIVRELLTEGHEVTAVARSPAKLGSFAPNPRLRIIEMDLEDESRFARMLSGHDVCVHAALIWGDPESDLDLRDTAVAAKLFDVAGSAGVRMCIYVSSVAVHRPFTSEMREEDSLSTIDTYGATKAAGELFLRAACAKHGMTGIVVRPGPVVGLPAFAGGSFRSHNRIAEIVADAAEGRAIEVVRGDGRQFSDVSMVATAIRLITRIESPHPTYICVARDVIAWEQVARVAVDWLSSSSVVRVLPPQTHGVTHRFRTERIDGLLGGPSDAEGALAAHIRCLARPCA
jgi:UDP-glucose 4-epimerase